MLTSLLFSFFQLISFLLQKLLKLKIFRIDFNFFLHFCSVKVCHELLDVMMVGSLINLGFFGTAATSVRLASRY